MHIAGSAGEISREDARVSQVSQGTFPLTHFFTNAGLWGWIFWLPGRNTPVRMSSGGGESEGPSGSKASHPHPLRALHKVTWLARLANASLVARIVRYAHSNLDDFRP